MLFACDEPKRQANLAEHGFDRFLNIAAKPSRTGRVRFKLIGLWHGDVVVVAIASPLGSEAIDIVSVRRANGRENVPWPSVIPHPAPCRTIPLRGRIGRRSTTRR